MLFSIALLMAATVSNTSYTTNTVQNVNDGNCGIFAQLRYNNSKIGKVHNISENDGENEENAEKEEKTQPVKEDPQDNIDDESIHSCVDKMKKEDADSGLIRLAYSIASDLGVSTDITINR
jgi:hypothetical protein